MTVQEIIYTSAQKGLKPGSSGFCTVVCTAGMDQRTASRLEGLSGYRHPFEINDPRNPVNFQHITMRIGAANTHVMSRVCDAGPDHTGRTNKLAHHIAFTQPPSPSGPARLFEYSGLFASKWDGKTSQRAAVTLPSIPLADVTLSAWQNLAQDGGWAGYVAEQLISSKQPVYILFPAGTDTLSLLKETLDVVPASRRWAVTFSTYYTNPVAGAECQLRFVLDGTKDAIKLRNDARAVVVDLTTSLPKATGGELVTLARSGVVSLVAAVPKQKPNAGTSKPATGRSADLIDDDWMKPDADDFNSAPSSGAVSSTQAGTGSKRPPAPNLFGARRAQKEQRLAAAGKRSGKGKIIGLILGVFILFGAVSAGVWVVVSDHDSDLKNAQLLAKSTKAREEAERQDKRKADEARAKKEEERQRIEKQKRADEKAEKEEKDRIAADAAKLAKRNRKKNEPAGVVAAAEPPPPTAIDIFDEPVANGVPETAPVVRVIEWDSKIKGLDIPVDAEAELTFQLLHHAARFETSGSANEWEVKAGVVLKTRIATITREQRGVLQFRCNGEEGAVPRAVLQIESGERRGFVIFQQPQQRPAIDLAEIIAKVTSKSPKARKELTVPAIDGDLTQVVQIRQGDGRILKRQNVDLDKSDKPSLQTFDRTTTQRASDLVVFHFANGPKGAEHRHVVSLFRNRSTKLTDVEYHLEFAKQANRQVITLDSASVIRTWLGKQLPLFQSSDLNREWQEIKGDAESWAEGESSKLERRAKIIESGLRAIQNHHANGLRKQAKVLDQEKQRKKNAEANKFEEMEPHAAVLELLEPLTNKTKGEFDALNVLRDWGSWKQLNEDIQNQASYAAESLDELRNYKLQFSVYLTVENVRLSNDPSVYQLRIPVIEFNDRANANRLEWTNLSKVVDTIETSPQTNRK